MAKKNFRDDIVTGADRFFSAHDDTQGAQDVQDVRDVQNTQGTQDMKPYRINLKLNGGYKEFLADEAWKRRMSITELLNQVIGEFKARVEGE